MADLQEIEAIKRLKYTYLRCLDLKQWAEMAECFTEDATAAYGDGKYSFAGRDKIMQFLRDALGSPSIISSHRVQQPEIDFTSATTATGTWALYNYMYNVQQNRGIRIGAYYHDRYVKQGVWKFQSIGYTHIFHEEWKRDDIPSLRLVGG